MWANGLPFVPVDPNGVYMVLAADNIIVNGYCTDFCGFHDSENLNGVMIRYAFFGVPTYCPNYCGVYNMVNSPNNDIALDSMISTLSHELAETVINPDGESWQSIDGEELGDLCQWSFGAVLNSNTIAVFPPPVLNRTVAPPALKPDVYSSSPVTGPVHNMVVGGVKVLVQQLWRVDGGCGAAVNVKVASSSSSSSSSLVSSPTPISNSSAIFEEECEDEKRIKAEEEECEDEKRAKAEEEECEDEKRVKKPKNIIKNGDFEDQPGYASGKCFKSKKAAVESAIAPWKTIHGVKILASNAKGIKASSGYWSIDLLDGIVVQNVTLKVGKRYILTFDLSQNTHYKGKKIGFVKASQNPAKKLVVPASKRGWIRRVQYKFVAKSKVVQIRIGAINRSTPGPIIDNVFLH